MLPNAPPRGTNIITLGRQTSASSRCFSFSPNERSGDAGPKRISGKFEWIVKSGPETPSSSERWLLRCLPGAEGPATTRSSWTTLPRIPWGDIRSPPYYSCSVRAYTELWTTHPRIQRECVWALHRPLGLHFSEGPSGKPSKPRPLMRKWSVHLVFTSLNP